jgi:hypothetical protein
MMFFLSIVESVKAKFETAGDLFEVLPISIKNPCSLPEVEEVENQIGFKFPHSLRRIYTTECSELSFYWFLREDKAEDFGYDAREFVPTGDINLFSPNEVSQAMKKLDYIYGEERSKVENLIPIFSYEPSGNMYCLMTEPKRDSQAFPVINLYHDEYPSKIILAENFDRFIDYWASVGFMNHVIADGFDFKNPLIKPIFDFLEAKSTNL